LFICNNSFGYYTQPQITSTIMLSVALLLCASCCLLSPKSALVQAAGAGRAFPVEAENYVTERFQTVNSQLEWDPSNFLVDFAGQFANCRAVSGPINQLDRLTPDGSSISGVVDTTDGSRSDIDAVNGYIRTVVDRWISRGTYNNQIRNARRFGCSVRPGCTGRVIISCLFSPGSDDYQADQPPETPELPPGNIIINKQKALAFTPEQYEVAEKFTGNKWDRSHFLENLSGLETSCQMIGNTEWPFSEARLKAAEFDIRVTPVYGVAPNHGSTDQAISQILQGFKEVRFASQLGCSIIPDCELGPELYAVVSCLYHEA
jgi:hypothetical protein